MKKIISYLLFCIALTAFIVLSSEADNATVLIISHGIAIAVLVAVLLIARLLYKKGFFEKLENKA